MSADDLAGSQHSILPSLHNIPAFQHSISLSSTLFTRPSNSIPLLFQRAHAVGDVPAQARERAAVSGSERVVALVRCYLAYGGAAGL